MAFESWDDAMFWHGSLIGYMAGVKSACKDEDKSSLLLRMADTQARLEFMESENAKLRNQVDNLLDFEHLTSVAVAYAGCDECGEYKQTMLRLFAENAKLLRLLQDAWGYINHPADATWTHVKRKEVRDSIGDRMRELGVN